MGPGVGGGGGTGGKGKDKLGCGHMEILDEALTWYTKIQLKRTEQNPNSLDKSRNEEEHGGPENKMGPKNEVGPGKIVEPPANIYVYIHDMYIYIYTSYDHIYIHIYIYYMNILYPISYCLLLIQTT